MKSREMEPQRPLGWNMLNTVIWLDINGYGLEMFRLEIDGNNCGQY